MRIVPGACRRTLACLSASAIAVLVLAAGPAHAADCPYADAQPGQATPDQVDQATVCLVNQQRAAAGLAPLAVSAPLADTATKYAGYMVANQHFDHIDLAGHDVTDRVAADAPSLADSWTTLGENLGWGTGTMSTARSIVNGWMGSPEHRANVLGASYNSVGVGIDDGAPAPSEPGARTFVAVFATQTGSKPATTRARAASRKKHRRHRRHMRRRHH